MKCKITGAQLKPFMTFGKMPIANAFVKKENFDKEFFFEMQVGFNEDLSLFQLNDHPKPEKMFNKHYPFFTGSSEFMKVHFKDYANFVKKNYLNTNSKVIEIGSNDGTFLNNFSDKKNIIGFEPSSNVADKAQKNNIPTINEFFNTSNVSKLSNFLGNTDLICASNVICHVPNLNNLIESIDLLLTKSGTFVFEEPYLGSMFDKVSYDQIYDEHIFIFSATAVKNIFKKYNFDLVDAFPQNTHGGSMRYIVKREKISSPSHNLKRILEDEKKIKLDTIESCLIFKEKCKISKEKIKNKIINLKKEGKSICGYAATSKSTTVLNYCGINVDHIDYICDTTIEKIGKYTPGTHIPIKNMDYFYKNQADSVYLFAWNHKNEILQKEKDFKGEWFSHVAL
jgi:methylation protein EvaC|tara:strand:+ start:2721 stop:3908 length:1188 start_codon:yes stop_codon:yes gene_type:complete